MAQVLAQQAQSSGISVKVLEGLGNTGIVYAALKSGNVDLYPEYMGTISREILKSNQALSLVEINAQLAPMGLGVAIPLGFNNGYALAMHAPRADQLHIKSLSDLAAHPELKLGLSNEFMGRADGWPSLAYRYGLQQKPSGLDHGLAYNAIVNGQADVIDIYTTDAKIGHLNLRVLNDGASFFPRYDAVVLYRLDVPQKFPQAWAAIQTLAGSIDETTMIAMNAQAELSNMPFDAIARAHLLRGQSTLSHSPNQAGRGFWQKLWGADLWLLTSQHLFLVLVSVGLAALLGIPLAVWVQPHMRWRTLVLGLAGLLQTVPSLALLAALIAWLGIIGTVPALIALTLYSLLPIMRNTSAGLSGVPLGLRQSALSLGMTTGATVYWIELPLARPTILAGIRVATTISIGTATIAAFIGAGGYGERIVMGLALNDNQLLLAGALPAAALALLSEAVFTLLDWMLSKSGAAIR